MQLIKLEKVYGWIGKNEAVSMANVEVYIAACNTNSTTGNNQPKMLAEEMYQQLLRDQIEGRA